MSIIVNDSLKLIYLKNPKCASEYMENILKTFYNFTQQSNDFVNNIIKQEYIKNIVDNNFDILNINENYDNYTFFSLVRNPYERFLSGFLYFYGSPFIIKDSKILDCYEGLSFNNYTRLDEFNISHLNSLDEAIQNKDNLYENNIRAYGHLFIVQSSLLNSIKKEKIIKKMEELPNCLNEIFDKLKIDIIHEDYPKINDTMRYHNIYSYYTENSIKFVNEYFNDDFINFGYNKFDNLEEMKLYYSE